MLIASIIFAILVICTPVLFRELRLNKLSSEEKVAQIKKTVVFDHITKLETVGHYNVYYTQTEDSYLLIEGGIKEITALKLCYSNGELRLTLTNKRRKPKIHVSVFSPGLFGIKVSGGGTFTIKGDFISTARVNFTINGGKAFIDKIVCKDFVGDLIGGATAIIKSIECNTLCYRAVGSGISALNAIKIKQNADFISTGSGGIIFGKLYTMGSIRIKKVGSGTIMIAYGECSALKIDILGRGLVTGVMKYNTIQTSPSGQYSINNVILSKPHS